MKRSTRHMRQAVHTDQPQPTYLRDSLSENERLLRQHMDHTDDLGCRRIQLKGDDAEAVVYYLDGIVDKTMIDQFIVRELQQDEGHSPDSPGSALATHKLAVVHTVEDAAKQLLAGQAAVLVGGSACAYIAPVEGGERRAVSEPMAEAVVRGPRESFNESIQTNVGLIRKRLQTPKLKVENRKIGKLSSTTVSIMYVKGLAKAEIVDEVKSRLAKIDLDGIIESQYIEEFIEDPVYSPFPTVFNTERPDRVAAALLEGRIAILTDGTPIALIVPATISLFLYSNEDYYQRFDIASLLKLLRTVTFLLSFMLPSFYVALLTFHQEMIPTPLLIALTGQREGVPFGIAIEVLLMEITFEILREAGIRLPKTIGSAVSIVGGLVLGQAAVEASLVGAGTVIAVSATAIASFTTPSYGMAAASRMIRFAMLLLAAFIGAFGFFFGLIMLVIHLNSIRSFGVPYLSPIMPYHKKSWRDLFIRFPWWAMEQNPQEVAKDSTKMEHRQKWNSKPEGGDA
jgi:spore germination protein KA